MSTPDTLDTADASRPGRVRRIQTRVMALLGGLLLMLLVAGCGRPEGVAAARIGASPSPSPSPVTQHVPWPDDGAIDHPVATTGCGQVPPVAPGSSAQQSVAVNPAADEGYTSRTYIIHVPTGYDAQRPTPLLLDFHGGGGTAAGTASSSGFTPLAERRGFLAVYPQGLPFAALGAGYPSWSATGPLDTIANGIDDRLFVSVLLDALQRQYCVDPARIYATGFSAGGAMVAFLTCTLAGRFAAFAPMSGDAYVFPGGCHPSHPTSIIEFHGSADTGEPYIGYPAREDPDYRRQGVLEWLTTWAARDGCTAGPTSLLQSASVMAEQWSGCRDGTGIVHYLVFGLGHTAPPPIAGQSANDRIWAFFLAHPLQG